MVAVVVNDADAGSASLELKSAVDAAKLIERGANCVDTDVKTDTHCNRCRRVENIVHARDMQCELSQFPLLIVHTKTAIGTAVARTFALRFLQLDREVRAALRSICHRSPLYFRQQLSQQRI